jgi:hypothetical protein|tara:strand:+ start:3532 stop:4017 length:486 start_codon:yes stop_codon:yes gene_type:complete
VFIWFIAGSLVAIPMVFASPDLDVRIVTVAALLPVAEVLIGGPWLLHTLAAAVLVLVVVMLLTLGRRGQRQRWLGIPIGMFTHLVMDGTWGYTELFWWPAGGFDQLGGSALPEFDRFPGTLGLEVLGMVVCLWGWRKFGLSQPERRRKLWSEGRVEFSRGR